MNNRILFKSSLTIALLGILSLLIYSEVIALDTIDISQISENDIDKSVKVVGKVTSLKDLSGILLFDIKDKTSQIKVVVFKEEKLNIEQNDLLEIEGKIKEYKGELEIQAEKIIKK